MEVEDKTKLQNTLEGIIETLRQSTIIVEEFHQDSQPHLNSKLNSFIDQLKVLNELAPLFDGDKIPTNVLDFVDAGKNPDLFTKEMLDNCQKKNESTRGKIKAFNQFKKELEEKFTKEIPEIPKLSEVQIEKKDEMQL